MRQYRLVSRYVQLLTSSHKVKGSSVQLPLDKPADLQISTREGNKVGRAVGEVTAIEEHW